MIELGHALIGIGVLCLGVGTGLLIRWWHHRAHEHDRDELQARIDNPNDVARSLRDLTRRITRHDD